MTTCCPAAARLDQAGVLPWPAARARWHTDRHRGASAPSHHPNLRAQDHVDAERGSAELAATFVLRHAAARAGRRFDQGALALGYPMPPAGSPALQWLATRRVRGVPEAVHRGLLAWARGERRVLLRFDAPTPRELLAGQACGARVLSLLDEEAPTGHHDGPLAFAVHDLCHLEKFNDPKHYAEQVGLFARLHRALDTAAWAAVEAGLDAQWPEERDYVLADMNGSALFLLLALKARIRAATRRAGAAAPPPPSRAPGAPLNDHEVSAPNGGSAHVRGEGAREASLDAEVTGRHELLYEALALPLAHRPAARALTARGAAAESGAAALRALLQAEGRDLLLG